MILHLHNGDIVAEHARRAGIPGEHLAFRESLVTGPVTAPVASRTSTSEWIEQRARALAEAYGENEARLSRELTRQERVLDDDSREVVLWFEHDLYCLVHFLYLLQRVEASHLSYVWHPEPLAHVEGDALHRLFATRVEATPRVREIAREVWRAFAAHHHLDVWMEHDTPELPFLREGLSLVDHVDEHLSELAREEPHDFQALFARVDRRLGFGDTEVLRRLRHLGWRGRA